MTQFLWFKKNKNKRKKPPIEDHIEKTRRSSLDLAQLGTCCHAAKWIHNSKVAKAV